MSWLNVFSVLMASACVAGATMPEVLAQPLAPEALLAQTTGAESAGSQPITTEDLAVEDLSEEQLAQVAAIFETYTPQMDVAVAEYLAALEVLNNLLTPTTGDLAIINARNDVAD